MSGIARVVVSEVPHHITQRGNRRLQVLEMFGAWDDFLSSLEDIVLVCSNCHRIL